MGKRIRVQRKGGSPNYNSHKKGKKGPAKLRKLDDQERNDQVEGKIIKIIHDRGRGAPLAVIRFKETDVESQNDKDEYKRYKAKKEMREKLSERKLVKPNTRSLKRALKLKKEVRVVAVEGLMEGQSISFGSKADLKIGNCLPIGKMPEGTPISSVELKPGDRSKLAKQSGNYATIVGHISSTVTTEKQGSEIVYTHTQVKMPSGAKRTLKANCRAIVGIPAAGGRIDKPMAKAGNSYHKTKSKHKNWPRVRCVGMNRVDHKHGGGNHQHLPRSSCVSRNSPPGKKVGLVAARRTGKSRGTKKVKSDSGVI